MGDEVSNLLSKIEKEELNNLQLKAELSPAEVSGKRLQENIEELGQRKAAVLNEIKQLLHQIEQEGSRNAEEKLKQLLNLFRDLDMKDSDFYSTGKQKHLAEGLGIEDSLYVFMEKLKLVKKELGTKLRANLLLKRRLGDVPSQSELIHPIVHFLHTCFFWYEHRFSELYIQIQEKLRQTRKYYATYNALLEIKELMLKEVSLLNSINAQFQEAITSTSGRTKLIDSMEGILKGTRQKLEKVQLGLQTELKNCESLKQKCAASIAEQRHRSSLLKAFQDEFARSERVRSISTLAHFVS
ncbi:hypothetical protein H6P81_003892 [Aristolochia fimbriata]|uniref:CCDC93 coiled-coil domain-containing protein n=1 Tax=Aristolochia fimbriata TaxID=158543 RepID=A0AAV7FFX5_ARIFI|nr:hypothetical protein H6P81_003892 [Aristolochia fimbriata]